MRTALLTVLTDTFSNLRFTYQSNSVFTHSCKRTLSRKRTRTLLKIKIEFFFCLRSLVSGHSCIIIDPWQRNLSLICNKSTKTHCSLTEHRNSWDRFCQISICPWEISPQQNIINTRSLTLQ